MQDFAYDSKNRLVRAGNTHYTYDAENNRVAVSITGEDTQTTQYTINPNTTYSQTLIKTNPDGTNTYYIYGLGLLAQEDQTGYKAYHFDRRGSTVAITNAAGTITDEFTYAPYGELTNHTGYTETPLKFNGQYGVMTDDNGLYHMRARYYSPEIKRFVNQDVLIGDIGSSQSLNRYAYCNGNPVSFIDPFGLCGKEDGSSSLTSNLLNVVQQYGERLVNLFVHHAVKTNEELNEYEKLRFFGYIPTAYRIENADIPEETKEIYRQLNEEDFMLTMVMGSTGRGVKGGNLRLPRIGKPTSKPIGKPIEVRIGNKKQLLRVEAEPKSDKFKIHLQVGKGEKNKYPIDPSAPIEQQLPRKLNLTNAQKREIIQKVENARRFLEE